MEAHNRPIWIANFATSFRNAYEKSVEEFQHKDKEAFINSLIEYVSTLIKEPDQAADVYTEQILKRFKGLLKTAHQTKLFWHFEQDLGMCELGIIDTQTFNSLPPGQQGLTDQEYLNFLNLILRFLKNEQSRFYIYGEPDR
jgi:hypothetical protein